MNHYDADTDDRKRRKEEAEMNRESHHLKAISEAEALKKGGKSAEDKKKKKAKKAEEPMSQLNGVTNDSIDDGDESYDSIDEEEEYYQKRHDPDPLETRGKTNDDEDEDDDTLQLRDLVRPLEAWRFHLTGKEALEPSLPESNDESGEDEYEEKEDGADDQIDENGNEDSLLFAGMVEKSNGRQGDDSASVKRKGATSPAPFATS
jgi:hypothetical protein